MCKLEYPEDVAMAADMLVKIKNGEFPFPSQVEIPPKVQAKSLWGQGREETEGLVPCTPFGIKGEGGRGIGTAG